MKLVVGGSTGFVATELIRHGLKNPNITSIVALGRSRGPTPPEAGVEASKLKFVVSDNFENYPDSVKEELKNADACIWTIAVTPMMVNTLPFEETCKVSRDYAITAIQTLDTLREKDARPLRFLYMSGHFVPRSRAEVPKELRDHGLIEYGLMRGEAETRILAYAGKSEGAVQACIAKPGLLLSPEREKRGIPGLPTIDLSLIAVALLDQVINGFEKDTLANDDLVRIGENAVAG